MSVGDIFSKLLIVLSVVLAVLYMRYFKQRGKAYKFFASYLVLVAIIQIWMSWYATYKWNNLFLSHFYFIGQFIFLSLFYYTLLQKKWILWILGATLIGLTLQYIVNPEMFFVFNTYGMSTTQTILVIYALLYFYKSLTYQGAFLYINTGILFYLIPSILYFASFNFFLEWDFDRKLEDYIYRLHQTLYFIFEILIFIEWYKNYRLPRDTVSNA